MAMAHNGCTVHTTTGSSSTIQTELCTELLQPFVATLFRPWLLQSRRRGGRVCAAHAVVLAA